MTGKRGLEVQTKCQTEILNLPSLATVMVCIIEWLGPGHDPHTNTKMGDLRGMGKISHQKVGGYIASGFCFLFSVFVKKPQQVRLSVKGTPDPT